MTQESVVQGKTSHGQHGRDQYSHFLQIASWWYFVCIKCCGTQHVMHLSRKPWTPRHISWHMNCNIHKTEYPVTVVCAWWMCQTIVDHVNLSEISTVACYTADTWMRGWSLGWNLWPSCHTHLSTLVAASSHAGLPLWIWDLMRWIQDLHQMGPNVVRARYAKLLYDSTLPQ